MKKMKVTLKRFVNWKTIKFIKYKRKLGNENYANIIEELKQGKVKEKSRAV